VGPDCPLIGPEAAAAVLENCAATCRDSPAFADAVGGHASCEETVGWLARGSEPFADACLGDGPPDACGQGLEGDAECDRRLDCCGRGLVCADLGDGSRCAASCDARTAPTGCPARAFCSAFDDPPDGEPAPGVCIPGHDCVPGQEAATCDGPSTCVAVPPASFCVPAGDAAEGTGCTQRFDSTIDNCREGLVCAYGRCRSPCDPGGGCARGDCVDYSERLDGVPYRFCHVGCDLYRQRGCDDGVCELVDQDADAHAVGLCRPGEPGDGRQGDRCRSREGRYWGDCHPGHVCARLSADRGEQCLGFCDAGDSRLCTGRSLCVFGLLDALDLGLCLGECDVYVGAQCGEGRHCLFVAVGSARNGRQGPVGQCVAGGGEVGAGEACRRDPRSGGHDCAPGHVCTDRGDGADRCHRLCDDQHRCPAGEVCNSAFGGGIGTCD